MEESNQSSFLCPLYPEHADVRGRSRASETLLRLNTCQSCCTQRARWLLCGLCCSAAQFSSFPCTSAPQSAPPRSCCRPSRWPLACIWRHLSAGYDPTESGTNKSLSVDNGAINSAQVPADSSRLRTRPAFETVFKRLSIFTQTDQGPSPRGHLNNLFSGSRANQSLPACRFQS